MHKFKYSWLPSSHILLNDKDMYSSSRTFQLESTPAMAKDSNSLETAGVLQYVEAMKDNLSQSEIKEIMKQ